jgi:type I restriction enzyme, S subunit
MTFRPSEWPSAKLGRFLAARTQSVTPSNHPDRLFELYSVPSHETGRPELVSGATIGSAKQLVGPGDVLICKINPRINRVWVVGDKREHDQIGSTEWIRFGRCEDIVPAFLAYHLQRESVREHLAMNASGVGGSLMRVKSSTLAELAVPLPHVDVQRRVVARINELFSELDNGEEELARARADLKTYRSALLKAAVTGELTRDWRATNPATESAESLLARIGAQVIRVRSGRKHAEEGTSTQDNRRAAELPETWTWTTLPRLGEFGRGKSKHRPRNDPRLYGGPYPFVQTGVVAASGGRITRYEQTYSELGLTQSKLWKAGTLCITIAANIAKTGVLSFDACFPDSVIGLTCAEGINPAYVELAVRSLQAQLERDAPATAQKNINLDTFFDLPIALPPTEEQLAIVNEFNEAVVAADAAGHRGIDDDIANLRQSILAAAFRGELL